MESIKIQSPNGTLTLDANASPTIDDMNDIIASVTRNDDDGREFQKLCDVSTAFVATTNEAFLEACQNWIRVERKIDALGCR